MKMSLDLVQVPFRNCTVSFRIPSQWIDVDEEGTGAMYAEPGRDDGALRLDVISVSTGDSPAQDRMVEYMSAEHGEVFQLSNGNVLRYYSEDARQDDSIVMHYWHLGCALRKDFFCIAVFSYTLLKTLALSVESLDMVEFLRAEIRNASISQSAVQ